MPLTIPDELLAKAGLSERDARIEIACRLYDAGKLTMPAATRWASLSRTEFEEELLRRKLAICRPTSEDLKQDLDTLKQLEL
jgi:predicted HTH domain antitoxin